MGLKYLDEVLPIYVDSETVRRGKVSLFNELWHNILPYYANGKQVPIKTVVSVERVLKDCFGDDYFLVGMLMHQAGAVSCRLRDYLMKK